MASQSSKTGASFFSLVLNGLASVGGLVVAFLIAPLMFEASRDGVFAYAEAHYWDWVAQPVLWLWFVLCMMGSYFAGHLVVLGLYALTMFLSALWATRRR